MGGSVYDGQWQDGLQHGFGSEETADNIVYHGQHRHGYAALSSGPVAVLTKATLKMA